MDTFVQQLELAGFRVTPAMRLRLLKTLGGPGKKLLHDTKKLKFILCPVVAQSGAEQQRFYELFDRFHKDVLAKEWEASVISTIPFWRRMPAWWKWVLISLPILALTAYFIYDVLSVVPVPPKGILAATDSAPIGGTAAYKNIAPPEDSLTHNSYWTLIDDNTGAIELSNNTSFHWQFKVPPPGGNPRKRVRLIYENRKTAKRDTFFTPFIIECVGGAPKIVSAAVPREGQSGKALEFKIEVAGGDSLSTVWDFGDGSEKTKELETTHAFEKGGNYAVEVIVSHQNVAGFCESFRRFQVSIGQEKAFLALKSLQKDKMEPMASFGWATWLLMSLLALAIVYYWVRWFAREAPEVEQEESGKTTKRPDHFKSSDKAPYLIPYRSQNAFIRVNQQLFRFADTMRSRQEGLRSSLDIPGSVKATIDGGGFPRLLEKRDTQPTEYLFLIDEQSMQSHQAKLFDYLINFLKEKDVLLETFYYNTDFNRFWNKYYPKGIDDVILPRLYPDHRLVVLGDGHGLLDAYGQGNQLLRQETQKWLQLWKERLLITPLPPESWTWKEEVLNSLFPIFPADVQGLGQAMDYIESGQAQDEHQPDFATWKKWLLADRSEADVNRRRWHRIKTYKDFLHGHPDVFRWMCALAVCPQPNWETTIAIGKALKPLGVEVTFDKLLLLTRIPFLQTGMLPGRLRLEMLQEINEETERLARKAIKEALEAIKAKVKSGHANFELQAQLAVQTFVLHPENTDHQSDIRYLLDNGLLDKRQVAEMEKAVERHTKSMLEEEPMQKSVFTKTAPILPTLQDFLEEEPLPPQEKPFLTPDFIKAVTSTIIFILLFFGIWNLDGTDQLYQLSFGDNKTMKVVGEETELQNLYHFVQETLPIDSAKILNNSSISIYENLLRREIQKEINGDTSFLSGILPTIDRGFDKALQINSDYKLAEINKGKLWYNVGAELYNGYLTANQLTETKSDQLQNYFSEAIPYDSTLLDALHGKGLLHYYEGKTDSAFWHYRQILTESDSLFFDTLETYPHLQWLLFKDSVAVGDPGLPATSEVPVNPTVEITFVDSITNETISGITVQILKLLPASPTVTVNQTTNRNGNSFFFSAEPGKSYQIITQKPGYQAFTRTYLIDENFLKTLGANPLSILLKPEIIEDTEQITAPRDPVFQQISTILEDVLAVNKSEIVPEAKLVYDLGVDELDFVEIIMEIENIFSISISDDDLDVGIKTVTVQFIYDLVKSYTYATQDSDNDGIPDNKDRCPETGPGEIVDATGCSAADMLSSEDRPNDREQQSPPFQEPEMVFVQGGTFLMGCDPEKGDNDCLPSEQPVHEVQMDDFFIGKYEVTQEEWEAMMGENPSRFKNCSNCPVETVSWNDVQEFINKLIEKTGKKYRLPTEAEWEFAARGGNKGVGYNNKYAGSDDLDEVGWYTKNSYDLGSDHENFGTNPVGLKKANELGLYDMSGNVWEWCGDWYGDDYYRDSPKRNPKGPSSDSNRVSRGGSWNHRARNSRVGFRSSWKPDDRYDGVGFRLALSL